MIGGGFSGLLTAIHLLASHPTVRVRLVEKRERLGEGRAYGATHPDHLLNVRAANMSAFPDRPGHFLEWLGEDGAADAFVSRGRYAEYLQSLLGAELQDLEAGQRLSRKWGEAVEATRVAGRWRVRLACGHAFYADAVILALGFLPPVWPASVTVHDGLEDRLIADPWGRDLSGLPRGDVLLLGTGLTMVDMALALAGTGRRLTALSRRGLAPLGHGLAPPATPPAAPMCTPIQAVRALRAHARLVGWRSAVDAVRPVTTAIWRGWSQADRARFLRHLQPWWDVHRHRMAPAVAERIAGMRASGELALQAGRLEALRALDDGAVEAVIRPRGSAGPVTRRFAAVINCASSRGDPGALREGLVADLYRQGLLRGDRLRLGLDTDENLRAIGGDGRPSRGLYAVGPLTRAAFWEAVAVPDLRNQTAQVARVALLDLEKRSEAAALPRTSPSSAVWDEGRAEMDRRRTA
ncbi:MAG: FAD/NAD(P)-binding protein [Caulobacteraceae bacterium]